MREFFGVLLVLLAWVGHAYILVALLNNLYGRRLPKSLLKPWRLITAALILAFPLVVWLIATVPVVLFGHPDDVPGEWALPLIAYYAVCVFFGGVFLVVTVVRAFRRPPTCLLAQQTRTLDLWPELGEKLIGDGKYRWVTRFPGNCVFTFDLTELTLALPKLPPEWDGLTLLVVSDLHFHGTPSRAYFDRVFDELTAGPVPDLVCLAGDYLDSDRHHDWIVPLLSRLQAKEAKLAILGNHDEHHDPERIRAELAEAGYTVLGNGWKEITVRGMPCVAVGHEGPWFYPPPDLSGAPEGTFRLCLSHTPDNFYWCQANRVNLVFCGHVHGGGIRVPLVGSIFVPSIYGRRFDGGVFEENGTVMAVSRGVSGKEPLRIRCHPQAFRVTLKTATAGVADSRSE
jgi:predicted MPP superfamily phosphohydrolase